MIKIISNILNPINKSSFVYLENVLITINKGKIISLVNNYDCEKNQDAIDKRKFIIMPGMIDLHVHLSQFNIMGMYKGELLDWLKNVTFPAEIALNNHEIAKQVSQDFFYDMLKNGTTSAMIYVTSSKNATNIAFQEAEKLGIMAFIGMVNMDSSGTNLDIATQKNINDAIELSQKWKNHERLKYVFTPRFAPACSQKLMKLIGDYASKNNEYVQTHLSENINEINLVKKLFPKYDSYTDVYYKNNLLGPKTILAHCIHLTQDELYLIKKTGSKIAHCPDSNFFLNSGRFPFNQLDMNIDFGLASDVGAGTSLNMFYHMKMAKYMQINEDINLANLFYKATLGNAKILGADNQIGSIEKDKYADFIVLKNKESYQGDKQKILSDLIFTHNNKISEVWIKGKKVIDNN